MTARTVNGLDPKKHRNKMGSGRAMSKAFRDRNRPYDKMTRSQLETALASRDRIAAISAEIRARHGLPPVPEGPTITAARARLAGMGKPRRKPTPKPAAKPTPAEIPTRPAEIVAELEILRERERELMAALEKAEGISDRDPLRLASLRGRRGDHPQVAPGGLAGLLR